jgi:hypothetical protein
VTGVKGLISVVSFFFSEKIGHPTQKIEKNFTFEKKSETEPKQIGFLFEPRKIIVDNLL